MPDYLFEIAIQGAVGGQIFGRTSHRRAAQGRYRQVLRRDIRRERRVLQKQQEGEKPTNRVSAIEVPSSSFFAVLEYGDDESSSSNSLCVSRCTFLFFQSLWDPPRATSSIVSARHRRSRGTARKRAVDVVAMAR